MNHSIIVFLDSKTALLTINQKIITMYITIILLTYLIKVGTVSLKRSILKYISRVYILMWLLIRETATTTGLSHCLTLSTHYSLLS